MFCVSVEIIVREPQDTSPEERGEFAGLVKKGSEVVTNGLSRRIDNALLLAFARAGPDLIAVAGIKQPDASHIKRFFGKAHLQNCSKDYKLEFGWAFTEQAWRGKGIGTQILCRLLKRTGKKPIWASTKESNSKMQNILSCYGFTRSGIPFLGDSGENLIIWLKY